MITSARVREIYDYNADTGEFVFRIRRGNGLPGKKAGCMSNSGYFHISIDRKKYLTHRLAWLFTYGEWPISDLDHINMDKTDNRISNLRLATRAENSANTLARANNTSGFKGVTWHKDRNKWQASIKAGGKNTYLGLHRTAEAAYAAYCTAAIEKYGKYARTS